MKFKFNCPQCGQRISATDEDVGDTAFCPGCHAELTVPPRDSASVSEISEDSDAVESEAEEHAAPLERTDAVHAGDAEAHVAAESDASPEGEASHHKEGEPAEGEPAQEEHAAEPEAKVEAPRFRTRMHPVGLVCTALGAAFWTGVLFTAAGHPAVIAAFGPRVCGIARIAAPICFLISVLPPLLRFLASGIEATRERLIVKTSLTGAEPFEISLSKIKSVSISQDGLGRILNFGTVVLQRAGGVETFELIAKPRELQNWIETAQLEPELADEAALVG